MKKRPEFDLLPVPGTQYCPPLVPRSSTAQETLELRSSTAQETLEHCSGDAQLTLELRSSGCSPDEGDEVGE